MKKKRLVRGARNVALTTMLTAAPFVTTSLPIFSHAAHATQAPTLDEAAFTSRLFTYFYDGLDATGKTAITKAYNNIGGMVPLSVISNESFYSTLNSHLGNNTGDFNIVMKEFLKIFYPKNVYTNSTEIQTAITTFRSYSTQFHNVFGPNITVDDLLRLSNDIYNNRTTLIALETLQGESYEQAVQDVLSALMGDQNSGLTNVNVDTNLSTLNSQLSTQLGIGVKDLLTIQNALENNIDSDKSARSAMLSNAFNQKNPVSTFTDLTAGNNEEVSLTVSLGGSQQEIAPFLQWKVYKSDGTTPATNVSVLSNVVTAQSNASGSYVLKAETKTDNFVLYTKDFTVNATSTGGGVVTGGGTGGSTSDNNGDVNIDTGSNTSTETNSDGQKQVVVTVKSSDIENAVNNATDLKTITINVPNQSGSGATAAQVSLPAQAFDTVKAKNKNAQVQIKSDQGTYSLPVNQIDTQALAKELGVTNSSDVKINIQVKKTSDTNNVLTKNKLSNVSNVVEFSITATAGGKSKQLDQFNVYVKRSIPVGNTIDPTSVTGVRLNPDGSFTPVPTVVTNGQVSFLSRTNSKYTVVEHHASFTDIPKDYWAANFINTLGNKYIIHGKTDGSYAPRQATTRVEFAILLTKALGLTPTKAYDGKFKDVKGNEFYIKPLEAAVEAGLIKGKQDGSFDPNAPVTREEAAAMLNNALNFVGYDATQLDASKNLSDFKDSAKIGDWAKAAVTNLYEAGIFHGKTDQTFDARNSTKRDQMAVVLEKFLQFIKFSN